ncbi:hypothetical protein [Absidia glauca]|uniref:SWIM-type domain-containing protein n=1 Tax=Absidia glauca TaxID=4829 RepID=A0A168L980_ABSGL|nr:hypothetical protein [Absidia glauca]
MESYVADNEDPPSDATARQIDFSILYNCHRSGSHKANHPVRIHQKKSKKVGCSGRLLVQCFTLDPSVVKFSITSDHSNHVPGSPEDVHTLPVSSAHLAQVIEQMKYSRDCRRIGLDTLHQLENFATAYRRANYEDIYNQLRRQSDLLYRREEDDMASFKSWLDHLQTSGYVVFDSDDGPRSQDWFARGFHSPAQQQLIPTTKSFCLDATHNICHSIQTVLYSLVIRHPISGRGYPVSYMITNNRGVAPLVQWLQFLRDTCEINPDLISVDCDAAEHTSIKNVFRSSKIRLCAFHVTQAWSRNINSKVYLSDVSSAEQAVYKGEMMNALCHIISIECIDELYNALETFLNDYAAQVEFLDYMENEWLSESRIREWSKAYFDIEYAHMSTNNYIESWHNQLKTYFLARKRNRRLDRLVYILVHDVERYYLSEQQRIASNEGRMGPHAREDARRRHVAESVDEEDLIRMVTAPGDADWRDNWDDEWLINSIWLMQSSSEEEITYQVSVSESTITSCTCYDHRRRQPFPCKHTVL